MNFLWLAFHQVHHSPSRIETITSFYKHPTEIVVTGKRSPDVSGTGALFVDIIGSLMRDVLGVKLPPILGGCAPARSLSSCTDLLGVGILRVEE